MFRRVGITMRISVDSDRGEMRDCLAHDWREFLAGALPEVAWIPIPNIGDEVTGYVSELQLQGIILTGGEDIGQYPERDQTEAAVLGLALEKGLPVFGVCRGLQLIQNFFGGSITPCNIKKHVGSSHPVKIVDHSSDFDFMKEDLIVNSYHSKAVRADDVATPLRVLAVSDDGLAECIYHCQAPLMAVQWHPERFHPIRDRDRYLLRYALIMER